MLKRVSKRNSQADGRYTSTYFFKGGFAVKVGL